MYGNRILEEDKGTKIAPAKNAQIVRCWKRDREKVAFPFDGLKSHQIEEHCFLRFYSWPETLDVITGYKRHHYKFRTFHASV